MDTEIRQGVRALLASGGTTGLPLDQLDALMVRLQEERISLNPVMQQSPLITIVIRYAGARLTNYFNFTPSKEEILEALFIDGGVGKETLPDYPQGLQEMVMAGEYQTLQGGCFYRK